MGGIQVILTKNTDVQNKSKEERKTDKRQRLASKKKKKLYSLQAFNDIATLAVNEQNFFIVDTQVMIESNRY